MASNSMYSIPERFRRIENLHIVFWLIKDMSWAMLWRPLGIVMIFPTVIVAALITWQTRKLKSELYHNLAVLFWILANCYWMIVEFMDAPDHYRYYAAVPFGIGFAFIAAYYLLVKPAEKKNQKTIMINIEVPENTIKVANAG